LGLVLASAPFVTHHWRLAGLPEIPEPFDTEQFGHVEVAPADNAFELYRLAADRLIPASHALGEQYETAAKSGNWQDVPSELRAWLDENHEALELYCRGSERPDALYFQPKDYSTFPDQKVTQDLRLLSRLARLETMRLEAEGDEVASWRWHRAMLRSSRHLGLHGPLVERLTGAAIHATANEAIVRWACLSSLDTSALRGALDDIRSIYNLTVPPSVTFKVDYYTVLRLCNDPDSLQDPNSPQLIPNHVGYWLMYPLGEPEMSRRVARHIFTNWIGQCDRPRRLRTPFVGETGALFAVDLQGGAPPGGLDPVELDRWWRDRSRLALVILPAQIQSLTAYDREKARQSLLEAILALQIYQRENESYPEVLDEIRGSRMEELPIDPFGNGESIRYRRESDPAEGFTVWSIGPDGIDDGGTKEVTPSDQSGDLVYRVKPRLARGLAE
jgi:hypothetical protein